MDVLRDANSEPFLVPAGKTIEFKETGEFVRCLSSDGEIEISFNRGGARSFFSSGLSRRTPNGSIYQSFELHNPTGTDVEGVITFGYGDVEDNRLQASGNLNVINASGDTLAVHDGSVWSRINDVRNALLDLKAKPNVDLSNATHAKAVDVETVVAVTAVANTAGVWIHRGSAFGYNGTSFQASILMDDVVICGMNDSVGVGAASDMEKDVIENYFIPAGKKVSLEAENSCACYLWYEVLA